MPFDVLVSTLTFRAERLLTRFCTIIVLVVLASIFTDENLAVSHVEGCSALETDWRSALSLLNCMNICFRLGWFNSLLELDNGIAENVPLERDRNYYGRC